MCIDAQTSISSFIIGSIVNICVMLYFNKKVIYQLCIFWQWVLIMQLAEFLIWSDADCGLLNYTGTKMALFFNITQPIILFFVFLLLNDSPKSLQITSAVIILAYIGYFFNHLNTQKEYMCVKKKENCSSLDLAWWDDLKTQCVYYSAILLITFLLSDLSPAVIFFLVYSIVTLLISSQFYSCGGASMWCWFAVPFPLFLGLFTLAIGQ